MAMTRRHLLAASAATVLAPVGSSAEPAAPLIFFEPGTASQVAYEQAIGAGADYLVAPVVLSQDGALVVADLELSAVTDIASHARFAARRKDKTVLGAPMSGWFVDDFTLAELKTLSTGPAAKRGAPPPTLLTLSEVIDIARAGSVREARVVGAAPRMMAAGYFSGAEVSLEAALARQISVAGFDSPAAAMRVQSSEPAALKAFGGLSRARRVQLFSGRGFGLEGAKGVCEAVGVVENLIVEDDAKGPMHANDFVASVHAAGLAVYAEFRPPAPHEPHGARERLTALFLAGVDGVMCADAALAARARREAADRRNPSTPS
jgi:glycerophosphoryl diester phosphodiesterase